MKAVVLTLHLDAAHLEALSEAVGSYRSNQQDCIYDHYDVTDDSDEANKARELLVLAEHLEDAITAVRCLLVDPSLKGHLASLLATIAGEPQPAAVKAETLACPNCGHEYMREQCSGIRLCRKCSGPVYANPSGEEP